MALLVCAMSREIGRSIASLLSESERRGEASAFFGEFGEDIVVEWGIIGADDAEVFLLDDGVACGVLVLKEYEISTGLCWSNSEISP